MINLYVFGDYKSNLLLNNSQEKNLADLLFDLLSTMRIVYRTSLEIR